MKHPSIIKILILALCLFVAWGSTVYKVLTSDDALTPEQRNALPYLIDNMELARDTHQDIVDNPARHQAWLKGGVDHQKWVDIYEEIINILEATK